MVCVASCEDMGWEGVLVGGAEAETDTEAHSLGWWAIGLVGVPFSERVRGMSSAILFW